MQNSGHSKFILTPIIGILQDTVNACAGIGKGIETQSLGEYVLQTTFLKMTGASEQKLKCICWEMATNDYDYRYHYLRKNYGECSSYTDKCSIYKDIQERICKLDSSFKISALFNDIDITSKEKYLIKQKVKETQKKQEAKKKRKLTEEEVEKLAKGMNSFYAKKGLCDKEKTLFSRMVEFESVQDRVDKIIARSIVAQWEHHNYMNYLSYWKSLSSWGFAEGDALFCKELQDFYSNHVYVHRNRCAHNLMSFQNNLPTLKTLVGKEHIIANYYFYFSVLILLDDIFVRLYKAYTCAMHQQ